LHLRAGEDENERITIRDEPRQRILEFAGTAALPSNEFKDFTVCAIMLQGVTQRIGHQKGAVGQRRNISRPPHKNGFGLNQHHTVHVQELRMRTGGRAIRFASATTDDERK
jgi:hypothetical protein